MATPIAIMLSSSALLNDVGQQIFTSTNQLPYFNIALRELREIMEQHNIAYFNTSSTTTIVSGVTSTVPPTNLVEIRELLERSAGSNETFIPVTRVEYLPIGFSTTTYLTWWTWQN